MHAFTHFLVRTRKNLNLWHSSVLNNIDAAILNTETEISVLEMSDSDPNIHNTLVDRYAKLSALQRQSGIKWAQRARLQWIKDDDKNTRFFHAISRIRKHSNFISQISNPDGNVLQDPSDIEHAFLLFYQNLWNGASDTFPNIADALHFDLPQLADSDCSQLICDVTIEEVYSTLPDLPPGKSPGHDGFNVEFYRTFWPIIGDHLFAVINYFFQNSFMPLSWGKTFIVLIPKKHNPVLVFDFRPISLCNVCFKFISKILANRLKKVIPKLIGQEQVGFVADRCSFDNIITVQEVIHSVENDTLSPLG